MSKLTMPDGAVYEAGDSAANSDPAKTWDGHTVKGVVVKSDDEARYTLTVAYPADSPDVGRARDGFQDFASKEAVEQAAWNFMRNGGKIGAFHQDGTEGFGELVESYVYRGPDWPQEGGQVVKSGDWLIGTIWSEDGWNLLKSGEATGVSMQGAAKRRVPSPDDVKRVAARVVDGRRS